MLDFEIIRYSEQPLITISCPLAVARGTALQRDSGQSTPLDRPQAMLASGAALGFAKRDVVVGGPTILERADVWPGHAENPDSVNGMITLDPPYEAYEAEGNNYLLLSGTGALASNTAIGSYISFLNGKARVAQSGDTPQYRLSAIMVSVNTAGSVRCLFEKI